MRREDHHYLETRGDGNATIFFSQVARGCRGRRVDLIVCDAPRSSTSKFCCGGIREPGEAGAGCTIFFAVPCEPSLL